MDDFDEELDEEVNDIISQIKNQGKKINFMNVEKEYPELTPDQVDSFVLKYASKVIIDLAKAIEEQSDIVSQGGSAQDVVALSELGRAFQGNLEVLQKRKIADNKNVVQKEIKQMDINAKGSELLLGNGSQEKGGVYASREEIIKGMALVLLENGKGETKEAPPIDI